MFERKHQKIAPAPVFIKRLLMFIGIAISLILLALIIGIAGYHWISRFKLGGCLTKCIDDSGRDGFPLIRCLIPEQKSLPLCMRFLAGWYLSR